MSPKAWKASFSEFHRSYSPKSGQRHSFRSPEKPRHSTLSRQNSSLAASSHSSVLENPTSESRDLDTVSSHSEIHGPSAGGVTASGAAGEGSGEDGNCVEEEKGVKEGDSEPPAKPDKQRDGEKAPPSESSSELNNSRDSVSLELQLSAADDGPLHIEEDDDDDDSRVDLSNPKHNGLENGEVSGFKDLSIPRKVCHSIGTWLRSGDANLVCVFPVLK